VKLRGRTITPDRRRGPRISPGTRGANQTTHHGPLQRLLDLTPSPLARLFIVGQVVRINTNEVGFGISRKTYSSDMALAAHQRLQYAVHSVHDAAIARKDDGTVEIGLLDEASVFSDVPARHGLSPIRLVELANARNWHDLPFQAFGKGNEAIDTPGP
jgi:hypothetical protein